MTTNSRVANSTPSSSTRPVSSASALLTTRCTAPICRTVLDSGASRHLEVIKSKLKHIHACNPVTLLGINGKPVTISQEGSVGNCHNVLFAPGATASVRSVSGLLDSHGLFILFANDTAYMLQVFNIPATAIAIADRREDGLFHMRQAAVPPPISISASSSIFLSVPQQIKREHIHRLHRTLGHASPQRMAEALKNCLQLAPSLSP